MFVKRLSECQEFTANDGCRIRELLHPVDDALDLPYSIAIAGVQPGERTYRHKLKQVEVYFILAGYGRMLIDSEPRNVSAGDTIYIPAESIQSIENTGEDELQFMAIVSPPWRQEDDIRLE
ncbi:MAG: cupin domain-containing protein [Gammaproteobacteria bacterium]